MSNGHDGKLSTVQSNDAGAEPQNRRDFSVYSPINGFHLVSAHIEHTRLILGQYKNIALGVIPFF